MPGRDYACTNLLHRNRTSFQEVGKIVLTVLMFFFLDEDKNHFSIFLRSEEISNFVLKKFPPPPPNIFLTDKIQVFVCFWNLGYNSLTVIFGRK